MDSNTAMDTSSSTDSCTEVTAKDRGSRLVQSVLSRLHVSLFNISFYPIEHANSRISNQQVTTTESP